MMLGRPSFACGNRRALPSALLFVNALALPTSALTQEVDTDSITVIERGTPGVDGWDVAEFPFKVITAPLYLLVLGTEWAVDAASEANLLGWAVYTNMQLNRRGLYPTVASLGSGSGTGGALLVGVPARAGAPWAHLNGGATFRGYWRLLARVGYGDEVVVPGRARRFGAHLFGSTGARPQEEFFGIGRNSREEDRSDYELRRQTVGAEVGFTPTRNTAIRLDLSWSRVETLSGTNDRLPDIDSLFQAGDVSRFGETDRYQSIGGAAEWQSGRRGLIPGQRWLQIGFRWNESISDGAADFAELDATAGVVFPFDHDRRSLAFSLLYRTARRSGGGAIPFYRLPALGGTSTLSAYRTGRFRGRDLVLGQAEYSYRIWLSPMGPTALIASIFLHGGMVASDMDEEFAVDRLKPSYGTALSLVSGEGSGGRLELAGGDEGLRVNFVFQVGY